MSPTTFDWVLGAVLVFALPIHAAVGYRQFVHDVRAARDPGAVRVREYRHTIAKQWAIVACWAALLWWNDRPLDAVLPTPWSEPAAIGLTLLLLSAIAWQQRAVARLTPTQHDSLMAQLAPVRDLLPHSAREHTTFRWLAVTAGICEEILFRGHLFWLLGSALGNWGPVLACLAFGLGHAYQGAVGVLKTGGLGAILGGLYLLGGSLLWPIVVHAAVDLHAGVLARKVLGDTARST